jgi:flagellar hook-associated protein 3 FlgL
MERVTSLMTTQMMLQNLENAQSQLTTTANEISTGLRINQPSDDPYGTGLTLRLKGQAAALGSYSANVNDATAWTQTSSSALQSISNAVQRIRELTVEAANGTNSASNLQDDATEVGQLIDQIKTEANTQYNGQYVFAGTATTAPPYQVGPSDTYAGNANAVNRQIGPGTTLQVNADLSGVLGSGGGDGKLIDTLRSIQQAMASGNTAALSSGDLGAVDSGFSSLSQLQVRFGLTQNQLSQAASRILDLQTTNTTMLGNTQNVDIASVMTAYTTQQAAYQAALQATASILQKDSLMNFLSS